MARFLDAIDVPTPLDSAFDYLAQFQHSAEWDPDIVEARRLDDGPLAVGSRFEIVVSFLGRRIRMEYTLVAHEPPHRIVLRGTGGAVVSVDEITFPRSAAGRASPTMHASSSQASPGSRIRPRPRLLAAWRCGIARSARAYDGDGSEGRAHGNPRTPRTVSRRGSVDT